MRLGPIVMMLRLAETRFGNFIGGAADMDTATKYTLKEQMAFVVPLDEEAASNEYDNHLNQAVTERFGVVVAINNDAYLADKTGLSAYDQLHDVRDELFKALLGKSFSWSEGVLSFRGGQLMLVNGGWLWYMYRFELKARILSQDSGWVGAGITTKEIIAISTVGEAASLPKEMDANGQLHDYNLDTFDSIYAQILLGDDIRLHDGTVEALGIPLSDGFPDVVLPDQAQWIDLTKNPAAGAFWMGFAAAFKVDNSE